MVIDYAEKYGINIPVTEDSVVNEPLENGDINAHDELSALLQSATSKLLDGMNVDGPTESSSDLLGLGKLIQESLQNQSAPVKDEGAETNGTGAGLLESGGLASLIASKLTDFDHFSAGSNATTSEGQHHGLPQVSNGKFLEFQFWAISDSSQALCSLNTLRSTTTWHKRHTIPMGKSSSRHLLQRTEAAFRPIKHSQRLFFTNEPGRRQLQNPLLRPAARGSTRLAGPGRPKKRRLSWPDWTWSRDLTGARFCPCSAPTAAYPTSSRIERRSSSRIRRETSSCSS